MNKMNLRLPFRTEIDSISRGNQNNKLQIRRTALLIIAVLAMMASCKKPVTTPNNGGGTPPGDTTIARTFQFTLDSFPAGSIDVNLVSAQVSITNANNEHVVVDKKLKLSLSGTYVTEAITLPKAEYKVSKFLLRNTSNKVLYATPFTGSAKATLVAKPLTFSFSLMEKKAHKIGITATLIAATDKAEYFGYPAGLFENNIPDDNNNNQHRTIRVRPVITVGDVVYDSIPVTLRVATFDNQGGSQVYLRTLAAGTNELYVPKTATKFTLGFSKWGAEKQIELLQKDIDETKIYTIAAEKEAKKLKAFLTYSLQGANWYAETKTSYEYGAEGKVNKVTHYRKRQDQTPYIAAIEELGYTNGKVSQIRKFDEENVLRASSIFSYDNQGRLATVKKTEGNVVTDASINYADLSSHTGFSNYYQLGATVKNSNEYFTNTYILDFYGGNIISDTRSTSHGNMEKRMFGYDFGINPLIHLNIPDLDFHSMNKHNRTSESREYSIIKPRLIAYHFQYTYGADGYPVELITKYRSYETQQHALTERTVFQY